MTIPYGTMANTITDKSTACFSYLIEPATPCVLGIANYDENTANTDEFFLTAGGIVHSCPNIYELSMENEYDYRKLQSCDHLMFIHKQMTSTDNHLNTYNTESDRFSIRPRFRLLSTTVSADSINSEIELYKKRHAIGLSRKYGSTMPTDSLFFPTTWKSDNYLLFLPMFRYHSLRSTSTNTNKRSRSYSSFIG